MRHLHFLKLLRKFLGIRILDIRTKKPAQDLGGNSSIIFNLFKNPDPEPDPEINKKENKNNGKKLKN
jgi:hypothetical protein